MVIDSTVFIDYLRGSSQAKEYFSSITESITVSRIVVMEIIAGSKTKREMKKSLQFIQNIGMKILEVDKDVSQHAGDLFERYFHRFGLGITDALIAATAIVANEKLVTHNTKHFKFIKELDIIKPY